MTIRKPGAPTPAPIPEVEAVEGDALYTAARPRRRRTDATLESAGILGSSGPSHAMPPMAPGYGGIVETVFDLPDPLAEYNELEAALQQGFGEFHNVTQALARAEDFARRAHRLYVNAKVDLERYLADANAVQGAMWDEAVAQLSLEKERGLRTKQVTDSDVQKRVAILYPDEWRDARVRIVQAEQTVKHLERLADLFQQRSRTLTAIAR